MLNSDNITIPFDGGFEIRLTNCTVIKEDC